MALKIWGKRTPAVKHHNSVTPWVNPRIVMVNRSRTSHKAWKFRNNRARLTPLWSIYFPKLHIFKVLGPIPPFLHQCRHLANARTQRNVSNCRQNAYEPLPLATENFAKFRHVLLPRDAMLVRYVLSLSVSVCLSIRLSARLSVTNREFYTKTAKPSPITQTMPYDSPETSVYDSQRSRRNHYSGALKEVR